MPIQRALTLNLPADGINDETYNPFPAGDCSTIEAIRDEVEVLVSLQRPKKVRRFMLYFLNIDAGYTCCQ